MSIANTAQAERWNTRDGVAHWLDNQARYDRMNAPFAAMILDAAGLGPGTDVLCGAWLGFLRVAEVGEDGEYPPVVVVGGLQVQFDENGGGVLGDGAFCDD
jgi:hypothetical protein